MNKICENCNKEYAIKKYHKTSLCDGCYLDYRREYWRRWKKRKRYDQKPIIHKVDKNIRSYIFNIENLGYKVIDTSGSFIMLNGAIIFDQIADGWSQNIVDDFTILFSDGSKKSWVNLGVWIYYDLKFCNVSRFVVDIK
jgi:hypothetical protein